MPWVAQSPKTCIILYMDKTQGNKMMNDPQMIVDHAMQCGAIWAGIDNLALHKDRKAVAVSFSSTHDAQEFVYYIHDWLDEHNFPDLPVSYDEEFVLVWL
jgi:hypothetical protein